VLLGAGLSGCFGSSGGNGSHAGAHIGEVRLVNCADWKRSDIRERYGTIADLRDFAGSPAGAGSASGPTGHGATLDDDKAYKLFENWCGQDFARGFKLYKLYTRAAAFTPR
jgi:hypothetical protein